jgi:hypothetical protein
MAAGAPKVLELGKSGRMFSATTPIVWAAGRCEMVSVPTAAVNVLLESAMDDSVNGVRQSGEGYAYSRQWRCGARSSTTQVERPQTFGRRRRRSCWSRRRHPKL